MISARDLKGFNPERKISTPLISGNLKALTPDNSITTNLQAGNPEN
tara:strand:- start:665 stop:802 length:138 start_codon:yes stop_codon:yes gene_type:complete